MACAHAKREPMATNLRSVVREWCVDCHVVIENGESTGTRIEAPDSLVSKDTHQDGEPHEADKASGMHHPSVEHVLQFFKTAHLRDDVKEPAALCAQLARTMADTLPTNPELTVGLRKLLEAKDAFVRAKLVGRL